jgi:hypothetical protein
MDIKLSKRGYELLGLIRGRCDRGEGAYFVPLPDDDVHGAGDANCLRSLERKGLTKRERIGDYSYSITPAGKMALEEYEAKYK